MQTTTNYKLKKPDGGDPVDVGDFNSNADIIDSELSKRVAAAGGDIANTKISAADTITAEFPVPAAGDTGKGFLGKMKKFCSDFNSFKTGVITLGKLVNNAETTSAGYALDARMGKTLGEKITELYCDLDKVNLDLETKTIALPSLIYDSQDSELNYLHVSGRTVELNVDIVSGGISGEIDLVQIPADYIPVYNIYTQCRVATSDGVNGSAYCIIYTSPGRLRIILPTTYTAKNISAHFCWII